MLLTLEYSHTQSNESCNNHQSLLERRIVEKKTVGKLIPVRGTGASHDTSLINQKPNKEPVTAAVPAFALIHEHVCEGD